ncbi:MAG: hypothetical protein M3336_11080, partial [Chloroflexota bacterium]|nr:hypothetical protein [Chloroflexota bacterium]
GITGRTEGRMILTWCFIIAMQVPPDGWFTADKVKHFLMSAFVQSVSYSVLRTAHLDHSVALVSASGVTTLVAVGKELYDRRTGGDFSPRDLVWDAAGASSATLLLTRSVR